MTWRGRRRTLGSCAPPRSSSPGAGPCAWALPEDAGLQCGCCRVRPAARADRWQEAEAGGGAAEAPRTWAGSRSTRGPRPEVRGGLCLGHAFRSVHKTFCGASRVKGVVDSRSVTGKLGSEPTWPERFPHGGDGSARMPTRRGRRQSGAVADADAVTVTDAVTVAHRALRERQASPLCPGVQS